ncbi:MAG TPA: hypothetical protein VGD37_12390 [Kofleriaceae bacterium]
MTCCGRCRADPSRHAEYDWLEAAVRASLDLALLRQLARIPGSAR